MLRTYKKGSIAFALVVFFVASSFGFISAPQKTHAIASGSVVIIGGELPTGDIPFDLRELLDGIAWLAVKQGIRAMTASIVDWINSGFEGDPLYLSNPGDFFEDVALEVTGAFIYELGWEDSPLCTGFRTPVIRALLPQPYKIASQCTIEDVVGNIEEFTVGNWEEGGWAGWIQLTQYPQNNPYGAYILANEELRKRQLETQTQKRQDLLEGGGFLSLKRCVARAPIPGPSNPLGTREDIVTEFGEGDDPSTIGVDGDGPCMRYETDTPGHTIANQLDLQLGSGTRSSELADEFNESIAIIVDALINQFMLQGLRALSGDDDRGIDPYYTDAVQEDKQTLVEEIDKEIGIEEARIQANSELGEGLTLISETKECYETQKGIVQDPAFNPPSGVAPSISEVNDKIDTLDEKRKKFISAAGDSSISEAAENLQILEEMRTSAETAETPRDLAEVWNDFNDYKQGALEEEQNEGTLDDRVTLSQLSEEQKKIEKEKAQCEEDNAIFEQYLERTTPVECVGGCIEGGDEEEE